MGVLFLSLIRTLPWCTNYGAYGGLQCVAYGLLITMRLVWAIVLISLVLCVVKVCVDYAFEKWTVVTCCLGALWTMMCVLPGSGSELCRYLDGTTKSMA